MYHEKKIRLIILILCLMKINSIYSLVGIRFTFPGTKWCGPGNRSTSYDDLGKHNETDKCCRDHDHCPDFINAGQSRHGLRNRAPYTRLSCQCDQDLYDCLKEVKTIQAYKVGFMYFNIIRTKCYKQNEQNGTYEWVKVPRF